VTRGVVAIAATLIVAACSDAPPEFTESVVLAGVEVDAATLNRGQRIFNLYCSSCHGEDGSGEGPAARPLTTKPRDFRKADFKYVSGEPGSLPTDEDLATTIRNGRIDTGMPAWNGLTDVDRTAVIHYIKTFSPRWKQ
jgi:mono/diheme cytochrome c family protein